MEKRRYGTMQLKGKDTKLSREYVWLEAWKTVTTEAKRGDIKIFALLADKVLVEFDKRFNDPSEEMLRACTCGTSAPCPIHKIGQL